MGDTDAETSGIDYERLYRYRFRDVDQARRQAVWNVIAPHIYSRMGSPERVLDPAAGRREFVNAIPASERWAVDAVAYRDAAADPTITTVVGDIREVELPESYFDGIFVSNLLEHFERQEEVAAFLRQMRRVAAQGARIAVLGPNFRYCAKEYFDCADHTLALTHVAVAEHLYAAGFEVDEIVPRFIPYSFRSTLPSGPTLVRAYLRFPLAWHLFGKQFLVLATAP